MSSLIYDGELQLKTNTNRNKIKAKLGIQKWAFKSINSKKNKLEHSVKDERNKFTTQNAEKGNKLYRLKNCSPQEITERRIEDVHQAKMYYTNFTYPNMYNKKHKISTTEMQLCIIHLVDWHIKVTYYIQVSIENTL